MKLPLHSAFMRTNSSFCRIHSNEITSFFASANCFSGFVCQNTTIPTDSALYFQKNLNVHVISLERGDLKLSIGSFTNKFPYTVEGLLNILQSTLCLRSRDYNEECKAKSYFEPKLEKKTSETKQQ